MFIKLVSCDYVLFFDENFVRRVWWLMDLEEIYYFMLFKFWWKSIIERLCEFKDKVNDFVDRIFW